MVLLGVPREYASVTGHIRSDDSTGVLLGYRHKLKVTLGWIAGMPLLQFDVSLSLSDAEKASFAEHVTDLYTAEMATTSGHVAVTIRERDRAEMHLGRAVDGPLLFLDAEIRQGRSVDRKRAFALATMEHAAAAFDLPEENMKVVFTEHPGQSMMGVDRVGGEWNPET